MFESAQPKVETLAAVPAAIAHFTLDTLFERPVQAELVELLLLPKEAERFTSCVLIHGMGGTGKVSGSHVILVCPRLILTSLLDADGDGGGSNPRFGRPSAFLLHLLAGGWRGRGGRADRIIAGDAVQAAHGQGLEG